VRGKAAHSSLTPLAVNSVEAAARVVAHIAAIGEDLRDHGPRQAGFDVPYSTSSVCRFDGGIADNVVPEEAHFTYEFRDLPGSDVPAWQKTRAGRRGGTGAGRCRRWRRGSGFRFDAIASMPAFQAQPDEPAVQLGAAPGRHAADDLGGIRARRPACSSAPACPPWSVARARSTRRTRPMSM
jgi:acetylornithine deacetylase